MGEFQHRVAALAGCKTAMVATGWIIFQHVSTNGFIKSTQLLKNVIFQV